MLRKAWHLLKALVGRQDGRVPVDPDVHARTFGVKPVPAVIPAETVATVREFLTTITQAATAIDTAAVAARELLTPTTSGDSAEPIAPVKREKRADFKLAQRLAATARLNQPAGKTGRRSKAMVAPAGKPMRKRGAKPASKRVRKAKPQAWIIARNARKLQASSARVIAFPAAANRGSQQRLRKAA